MGRRRRSGKPINGWVILDKPVDMTSTAAVGAVRRIFDAQKAGHAGTLDPLATGVLPIALGEATKTLPYVVDTDKRYQFLLRWGVATSTDDREGDIIETCKRRPSEAEIRDRLPQFIGEIMQVPPIYSAIKVNGHRAYDLARDGEEVELDARPIFIDAFDLVGIEDADHAVFTVVSGKGAYMRAWRAILPARSGRWVISPRFGEMPLDLSKRPMRFHWTNSVRLGKVRPLLEVYAPLKPRWTTSRRWL